jgi:DNA polymerase-1
VREATTDQPTLWATLLSHGASHSRLLLVDGHAYAYRAFHAIRALRSPSGAPTNAIYGFIQMLGKMRTQLKPTHWAVVWDGGLAAERMAELPAYKEHRPPMPKELDEQIEGIVTYLEAAGCASLVREGVEADDWIASIARRAEASVTPVVIASSDKDFMQLVSERIGLLNPNDKAEKIWTSEDVRARTGVTPGQIVDWLSLIGDAVDNIPGVPGVGPKTATELLQQFGSAEALYARLAEVKSDKLRASLRAAEAAVRRNQNLIRLREDLAEDFSFDLISVKAPDTERLRALYVTWSFRRLLAQVSGPAEQQGALL